MFFITKLSNSSIKYYLEPGVNQSVTTIVEASYTLTQERHNPKETSTEVIVSRRMQKFEIHLVSEGSIRIFRSNVGKKFGVLFRREGPHKPVFAYDIVRIRSLLICTDLIELKFVGDTKAPLLNRFPFISRLSSGDTSTNVQYMNCHTFSNLQIRPLLKKIHSNYSHALERHDC